MQRINNNKIKENEKRAKYLDLVKKSCRTENLVGRLDLMAYRLFNARGFLHIYYIYDL